MRKSRKYISMPIISLKEGIQVGTVRNLVVDPAKMEIAALVIDQRGWFREQKIIPYSKVKSVGNDAITIDESANVKKPVSLPEILKLIKEKANPLGTRVIAQNGTVLGMVDEYLIDESTGKITAFEISGKLLEGLFKGKALLSVDYVQTLGSDVIVVTEDAQDNLEKIDGGLAETISNLKEGTSSLWESTKQKTIEISKNIKEKYDKKDRAKESDQKVTPPPEPEISQEPAPPEENLNVAGKVEIREEEVLPEIKLPEEEQAPEIGEAAPETQESAPETREAGQETGETAPDTQETK